jgi:ParB family transcriptional regulator, chromosome partitioning protein
MQQEVETITISEIYVSNPRSRNRQKWQEIVASIRTLGLKKPITVSRRTELTGDGKQFDLVCGQGRLEAFLELGETAIPAIVVESSREDRFLMSLVENVARRPPSNREILHEVKALRGRGYSVEVISDKLGHDRTYIYGLVHLIEHGEESLTEHVEAGRLPISVAIEIASGNDRAVSAAMSDAYQSGQLRGSKLKAVKRLLAERASKKSADGQSSTSRKKVTGQSLVAVYQQTLREQRALVVRAEKTRERLVLLTSAVRLLFSDENFLNLLRAEQLSDMPEKLAQRLR